MHIDQIALARQHTKKVRREQIAAAAAGPIFVAQMAEGDVTPEEAARTAAEWALAVADALNAKL